MSNRNTFPRNITTVARDGTLLHRTLFSPGCAAFDFEKPKPIAPDVESWTRALELGKAEQAPVRADAESRHKKVVRAFKDVCAQMERFLISDDGKRAVQLLAHTQSKIPICSITSLVTRENIGISFSGNGLVRTIRLGHEPCRLHNFIHQVETTAWYEIEWQIIPYQEQLWLFMSKLNETLNTIAHKHIQDHKVDEQPAS